MEIGPSHSESSPHEHDSVEMPRPTPAPLVLSVGMVLLAAGAVTSIVFMFVGAGLCLIALGMWIEHLLPGRGHIHEPLVASAQRPTPIVGLPGNVELLGLGKPGYRMRMPEQVHPISAGVKGGVVGGIVMPVPALLYGQLSGHGIWYPVNLLAGMALPGMDPAKLDQFDLTSVVLAVVIHVVMSVVLGMIYGVLMPTLPDIPKPLAWGALLAPMLWTGASYALMIVVNPVLQQHVDWPWFIASQFVFGVILASVMMWADGRNPVKAGVSGAICGGLLMPLPAMLWGYFSGHGIWYPVNLLAGMVTHGMDQMPIEELSTFHANWLLAAIGIHAVFTLGFGIAFGLLLPRLGTIPGPLAWGAML